ncbi:UNVERIFIED_CONTAM: diguanylate cyclase (GGDEF)-like protein [Brevibacillus sp. OAP136]
MPVFKFAVSSQKKISLATLMTALVFLSVVLTVTILIAASYQSKKRTLIDTTLTLNYSSAVKMGQTIDSLFKSMRSSLLYSAEVLSKVKTMDTADVTAQLELMRHSSNYFNSLVLVNENGIVQNASPITAGTIGNPIVAEEAKTALAAKKPYLSKPYITTKSKRLILFMSQPIFDGNGNYRGFIGGTIYLNEKNILNMIFDSNPTDKWGSYFYIVASDGRLLFHRDKKRIGEDISANTIVHKLIAGQSGSERMVNLHSEEMLAGYVKVRENGWGVAVVSPTDFVNEQLKQHINTMLLYMLPPFLVVALLAIILARKLAEPFTELANCVSKVGTANIELPEKRLDWNREASLLTEAICYALVEIQRQTDQLTLDASTDPLTGLANRRTLETIMSKRIAEEAPFSLIVMDIDRFKTINDTFGHPVGDAVLRHFATLLASTVRPGDTCCRFGGEEFIALIPHATIDETYRIAERIRLELENSENPIGRTITVSAGIAHFPEHAGSIQELIHMADQALYQAKETGRNRTVIADKENMLG